MAALQNPKRKIKRLVLSKSKSQNLGDEARDIVNSFGQIEIVPPDQLHALLPENAIHQGIAVQANPLHAYDIEDIPKLTENQSSCSVAVLDQVTDPHNVGAILRSAAAFGVAAVIIPDRHSPPITGVLARSASGAVETVPLIRVNNLARALDKLEEFGFWRIGMDGTADQELDDAVKGAAKVALILGSEGKGLRRLTAEKCDLMGKLPISSQIESLNVSNAAAIAFYEMARRLRKQ
ncbi:23S rRNA (guanosine(2251)-2'-O)-methyltransferase RlmB [Alphaproteobacteria bacterium 46_93_T64]|nr:23S rRNA (guanosine(2251)-2'-O)-methyltransferase RlmB [Alphaproteobacteria bacterium 46_93_T64]